MYKILEKKSGEVALEIEIEKDKLAKFTDIVAAELGSQVKVQGFRPGKAPLFMVEKEVGKDKFWAEVIDKAVPEAFYEAVIAEKLVTISAPQIRVIKFVPGEQLVFEAKVAVLPEMKDLKYKDFRIKPQKAEISEKDKKDALSGLLKKYSEEKEVTRASKKGDKVEIDFKGTLNGLPFDGGESKNHPIILGSNAMVPGFEEKLEGKKTGENFEFDVVFPKEYHASNLAGQKVHFEIKINKVAELVESELSDDFAKKFGLSSKEELKKELEKQLLFEKELESKRKTEEEILNEIIEKNKIEAPEILVTEEIHRMIHEAEHNLANSGLTMDKFLEMSKKTLSDLEKEMKPEAENRVKIGLVLGEVARVLEIKIEESEVDSEIEKIVSTAPKDMNSEDIKAAYETPERRRELGNSIIIKKTMGKLWESNVVNS